MSKGKIAAVIGLLLVALAGAWYFLSPAYAMSQLHDAAIAGDAKELEERIDFPAVRAALKADLRAELADDEPVFGGAAVASIADQLIDAVITPQTMAVIVEHGRFSAGNAGADTGQKTEWEVDREGFSRFRATPVLPAGETAPSMVFELDGLGWRVVEIDIPDSQLAPGQ
jgi:hypothetical protein